MTDSNPRKPSDYQLDIVSVEGTVSVLYENQILASSNRTLRLQETAHSPVYYFPRVDVHLDKLQASTHGSHCPFKGDARYWHFANQEQILENIAWSYEQPLTEMAAIAGHVAFYQDKVGVAVESVC